MDLTILIPTKDRHEQIKRIILYYKKFKFVGKIIILDSSNASNFLKNSTSVKQVNNPRISIFKYKALPYQAIKKFQKKIKTKYVCFSGDDDFFIISGLNDAVKFLKKNPATIGVNGTSIVAGMAGEKHNKLFAFGNYNHFHSNDSKPVNRLKKIILHYRVPLFSIFRKKNYIQMLKIIPKKTNSKFCPTRVISDEILESFLVVAMGKISHISRPFLIRTVSNLKKGYNDFEYSNPGFLKSYNFLEKSVVKILDMQSAKIFRYEFEKFKSIRLMQHKEDKEYQKKIGIFHFRYNFFTNFKNCYSNLKLYFYLYQKKNFFSFFEVLKWIKHN